MMVILTQNVPNLGELGETVKVAPGYARNFLFPRKLAVAAESGSAKQIEHEMRMIKRREAKLVAEKQEVAKKLAEVTIELPMRAGEGDKLFGSVTTSLLAEKLVALGFEVDRKQIKLDEPIKTLGIFPVPLKLGNGIDAEVKVWVTSLVEESSEVASS